jgi:hypothetical protein
MQSNILKGASRTGPIFTRVALVRTYNAGLAFALWLLLLLFLGRTRCSKYCIIVQFHHAFSILQHCMHLCPAVLPGSLARQPCPAALPGSLARQPCPAALPGSLARQPCPASLPGSLARQPCPAALPGRIASFSIRCRPACSIAFFFLPIAGSIMQVLPAIYKILRF